MKTSIVKKFFVLAIFPLFCFSATASAGKFVDVPDSHWAAMTVNYLALKGYLNVGDGHFNGNNPLTRYDAAYMFGNLFDNNGSGGGGFPDVSKDHWAYNAILKVSGNGLMSGLGDGTFQGSRTIKRNEFALMVHSTLEKFSKLNQHGSGKTSFSDVPKSHWAYSAIDDLCANGILGGYGDGTFKGENAINRFEAAVIFSKMLTVLGK